MSVESRDLAGTAADPGAAVHEHVAFAGRVIDEFVIDDDRKAGWRVRLDAISARLADPDYYLAVIGEFSSGKTTFVNAILGTDLMPMSAVPTTVAPVVVRSRTPLSLLATRQDGSHERWGEPAGLDDADLRAALHRLCTDENLPGQVRRVVVDYPAPTLPADLVLVDTPGTNADHGHDAVTAAVMADVDAAVVVCHAQRVLPDTLTGFLTATLDHRLLSRCVFILTHLDQVDPEEHDRLLRAAARRINRKLGIADPQVALTAPGPVLRGLTATGPAGGLPAGYQAAHWSAQFAGTRRWLRDVVVAGRPAALADTVLRLVERLLGELDEALRVQAADLGRRQRQLSEAELTDLGGFLAEQEQRGQVILGEGGTVASHLVAGLTQQALDTTRTGIRTTIADSTALQTTLREQVPALVRTALADLADRATGEVGRTLDSRYADAVAGLDAAFGREYHRLERVAGMPAASVPALVPAAPAPRVGSESFADAVAVASKDAVRVAQAAGVGAVAGAALGTMFLPGVGTVVGGLIGFAASKAAAARGTVKQKVTEQALEIAGSAFRTTEGTLREATHQATQRYRKAYQQRLRWYRSTYQETVLALGQRQRDQRDEIRHRAHRLGEAADEMNRRLADVQRQRRRLSDPYATARS